MRIIRQGSVIAIAAMALSGCVLGPVHRDGAPLYVPHDLSRVPDAVPQHEPRSRYGNPETYEVFGKRYQVKDTHLGYRAEGVASWYGTKFHGRRTSSGQPYDMFAMTAAHRSLPLPTYAKVTNLENRRSIIVKINDRGPFHDNRIIDLSYAAAHRLGMLDRGTAKVRVEAIDVAQFWADARDAKNKLTRLSANGAEIEVFPETLAGLPEPDLDNGS